MSAGESSVPTRQLHNAATRKAAIAARRNLGGWRGNLSFACLLNLAGSYAAGADLYSLNPSVYNGSHLLKVRVETPVCHVMRVAYIVAELRLFPAYFAHHRHLNILLGKDGNSTRAAFHSKEFCFPR